MKAIILFLMIFQAGAVQAFFSDYMSDSKSLGFAGGSPAYESASSFKYNPALAGAARDPMVSLSHTYSHFQSVGDSRFKITSLETLFPSRIKVYNMAYGFNYLSVMGDDYEEKTLSIGAGSWHFTTLSGDVLDGGINLKSISLSSNIGSESKLSADIGGILRLRDYSLGLSILNINSPAFLGGEKAARVLKFGVSKMRPDYSLNISLAKRNSPDNNYSLSSGMEKFIRTSDYGTLSVLAGLSAGDNKSFFSAGFGVKKMSYEAVYSFSLPLGGSFVMANSFSFIFRFGSNEEETEYQKLISREMKYRRDLMLSLDESEEARNKLKKEMLELKNETERLREIISNEKMKREALEEARARLNAVLDKHKQAQEGLKNLEEKRRLEKIKQLEEGYSIDWANYAKMKASGASTSALKGYLQRIINQYQNTGIDISEAGLEMQKLLVK